MKVEATTEGADIFAKLRDRIGAQETTVSLVCEATSPVRRVVSGKPVPPRTGRENFLVLIYLDWQKRGSDRPDNSQRQTMMQRWLDGATRLLAGVPGALELAARDIGAALVEAAKKNMVTAAGRKPLTENYASIKRWRYSTQRYHRLDEAAAMNAPWRSGQAQPIGSASGQSLASLKPKVEVRRG